MQVKTDTTSRSPSNFEDSPSGGWHTLFSLQSFRLPRIPHGRENTGPTLFQKQQVKKKSKERTKGLGVEAPAGEGSAETGIA